LHVRGHCNAKEIPTARPSSCREDGFDRHRLAYAYGGGNSSVGNHGPNRQDSRRRPAGPRDTRASLSEDHSTTTPDIQLVRPCPTRLAAARVQAAPHHPDDRSRLCQQGSQASGRLRHQQEPVRHHRLPSDRQRHHRYFGSRCRRPSGPTSPPKFASYNNVIYEPFNEPIDSSALWPLSSPWCRAGLTDHPRGSPNNIIIVPSMSYDQHPAMPPANPPGHQLVYTAHVYPGNWSTSFKSQVATAVARRRCFSRSGGTSSTAATAISVPPARPGEPISSVG